MAALLCHWEVEQVVEIMHVHVDGDLTKVVCFFAIERRYWNEY